MEKTHPRIGFAGLGWIGLKRLQPLVHSGWDGDLVFFDPDPQAVAHTKSAFPKAKNVASFEELLNHPLDGVVIASPSALHASQTEAALRKGFSVFCQKPLGKKSDETAKLVSLADEQNLSLEVDYSYRLTEGIQQIKSTLERKQIGDIYAVEAVFHNAYGPDKPWYYNRSLSGGGCLMDLGSHLVDMLTYLFDTGEIYVKFANLLSKGRQITDEDTVEDFAEAQLMTASNISIRLACSWKHAVGKDAAISLKINGTKGGLEFQNINGSFYDFKAEKYDQNKTETLFSDQDAWEGRTLCRWVDNIQQGRGFDPESYGLVKSAEILEEIYTYTRVTV